MQYLIIYKKIKLAFLSNVNIQESQMQINICNYIFSFSLKEKEQLLKKKTQDQINLSLIFWAFFCQQVD